MALLNSFVSNMEVRNFKILLVEDHQIIRKIMTMMLTNIKCEVDTAATGAEALNLFQDNQYDLILMDIGLRDTNGLSIAEKIRNSQEPKKANTPIAIVTAHSDDAFRKQAEAMGITDFIVKPCSLETCHNLIKKFSPSNLP